MNFNKKEAQLILRPALITLSKLKMVDCFALLIVNVCNGTDGWTGPLTLSG